MPIDAKNYMYIDAFIAEYITENVFQTCLDITTKQKNGTDQTSIYGLTKKSNPLFCVFCGKSLEGCINYCKYCGKRIMK